MIEPHEYEPDEYEHIGPEHAEEVRTKHVQMETDAIKAFEQLKEDQQFWKQIDDEGILWGVAHGKLEQILPVMKNDEDYAFNITTTVMKLKFGKNGWYTKDNKEGKRVILRKPSA